MPQETRERTRTTPRAILLNAIESAIVAGSCDQRIAEMWAHAALVARIARDLAPIVDVDPTDAAASGLLHDVGELLLMVRDPLAYEAAISEPMDHGEQLAAENAVFGVDHALLGAEYLLDQRLPDVIADAVADHHDPFRDSPASTIVIAAADEIACADPTRRHALDLLGIVPEMSAVILRSADDDHTDALVLSNRDRSLTE